MQQKSEKTYHGEGGQNRFFENSDNLWNIVNPMFQDSTL